MDAPPASIRPASLRPASLRPASLRIDKWLHFARFFKTRSLAASLVDEGEIRLNGIVVAKPSKEIRPGDEIELPAGPKMRRRVRVLAIGNRRGPAEEARSLYENIGDVFVPKDDGAMF